MSRTLMCWLALGLFTQSGCASLGPLSPLRPVEQALIYQPLKYPDGDWSAGGRPVEDAWFESADGTKLHGWFLSPPHPRGVALYCHGNAGNVATWKPALEELCDRHRLSVLLFDYRGYGRSDGKPSEAGLVEDARAARDWLSARTGAPRGRIIVIGRSLGGGVATRLAAEDGCGALVLQSTFTSLPEVARQWAWWMSPAINMQTRFPSVELMTRYDGPVLISHGDEDRLIPFEHGQQLFEAAKEPKQFVCIPGGSHNCDQTDDYRRALDQLIDSICSPGRHWELTAASNEGR